MESLIPELRAILNLPSGSDVARLANVGTFIAAAETLKQVVEGADGVNVAFLNTPTVIGLATTRRALLATVRQWAAWSDVSESALFYAVIITFWVSLSAGGCQSISEADVLTALCSSATDRMGGWGAGMIAGARICSAISCVTVSQAASQSFGAPPELLASFACHVLSLFHDRPAAFPAVTNEANLALLRLREHAAEGGALIVQAATHGLTAHCFSGDGAAVLAEHIRNALAAPLVPQAVAGALAMSACLVHIGFTFFLCVSFLKRPLLQARIKGSRALGLAPWCAGGICLVWCPFTLLSCVTCRYRSLSDARSVCSL